MSLLVIPLPPRQAHADGMPAEAVPGTWAHVLSADGRSAERQGRAELAQLPRADNVVVVLPADRISWHRLESLPRAPASRLRAALGGLLEEQLLDDDEALHLALQPGAAAGQPAWVAVVAKPWLTAQLAALQHGGLHIDRVVPAWAPVGAGPGAQPTLHFFHREGDHPGTVWLAASDDQGVHCLPLAGNLARSRLPRWQAAGARYSATPAAATMAERWLGAVVAVETDTELTLAAAAGDWNLLQFDLAPSHRGLRKLGAWWRTWRSPTWRPVRLGLNLLLVVQLLGLNLWAWHQRLTIERQREAMAALLRTAHPQVRAVLDAPLQMRRETTALREAAGVPGETDLEPLLAATASAWPEGQAAASQLRFEPGRLTLAATGMGPPQIDALRQRLAGSGWSLEASAGQLVISRAGSASNAASAGNADGTTPVSASRPPAAGPL